MENGVLSVETASAGTLAIQFPSISSITSANDHVFVLFDGGRCVGKPRISAAGTLEIATDALGVLPLDLAKVTALNPPPKKEFSHKGNIALNGRVTDGNTRVKSIGGTAEYEMRSDRTRLTLRGDTNYSEDNQQVTARNSSGGMKYDYFATKRLFLYTNASFQVDEFADLNLRTTLGAGAGYQFIDRTTATYYEELGVSFFDENFDSAPDQQYAAGRLSGKWDWEVAAKRVAFFHLHEFFFGFEDQDDLFADTKSGFRLTIAANFFATIQANYRWDNTPAPGKHRGDTEYLWGLGYSFAF